MSKCKERWHQLIREYKACQTFLTLHDVTFELVKECIKRDIQGHHSCFEDIEDDVLVKLFSEPVITELSIENIDRDADIAAVHHDNSFTASENLSTENSVGFGACSDYFDSEIELMDEACSHSYCDYSCSADNLHNENIYWPPDPMISSDLCYNGEDIDDYYNFFTEHKLNKFPVLFDDVVNSLLSHLDEEACDDARGDIVKLLCDRVGRQKLRRQ